MDYLKLIGNLKSSGKISSVSQVLATFKGDYCGEEVIVEISDYGESDNPHSRYNCRVTRPSDGKVVNNNLSDTVEGSLVGIHWYEFDTK